MGLQELESAVTHLATQDLAEFARWFEEFIADEPMNGIAARPRNVGAALST